LALHVQLKTELHACRMDIRRLTAEHMEIMVEESDPPCQPPYLAASKMEPLQSTDIETTSSGPASSRDIPSPMEKQDSVRKTILTL